MVRKMAKKHQKKKKRPVKEEVENLLNKKGTERLPAPLREKVKKVADKIEESRKERVKELKEEIEGLAQELKFAETEKEKIKITKKAKRKEDKIIKLIKK